MRERFGHRDSVRAESAERSRGASELHNQRAARRLIQPFDVRGERRCPYRTLEPEGCRYSLLQVRAPGHRRVAKLARTPCKPARERDEVAPQMLERAAHLEHQRGVENILRGRTQMDVARGLFARGAAKLAHQRGHRHASLARALGDSLHSQILDTRRPGNRLGDWLGHQAKLGFGPRQRGLDVEHQLEMRRVGKERAHLGRSP